MDNRQSDVIIVGGGMIGLFCAYYLAETGKNVLILEKGNVGQGASHGNCGLLIYSDVPPLCSPGTVGEELKRQLRGTSPMSIKPGVNPPLWSFLLRFAMNCNRSHYERAAAGKQAIMDLSRNLFASFFKEHPFSDYLDRGFYTLCSTRAGFDKYAAYNRAMERFGVQAEPLGPDRLKEREPAVREDLAGGFFHPEDHHVRPDGLVRHVRAVLGKKGVRFRENCCVTGFRKTGSRITALTTDRGEFRADQFVIASGAWSTGLVRQLGLSIPVQPGKGYSITMKRPGLCPSVPCYLYERSTVATPFEDGFRIGGTMEFSGWDAPLNQRRLGNLRKAAPEYLKEPFGKPVLEEWTGFRPMSSDDMPTISMVPGFNNTALATGHGMLGITLATGTGRLVSRLLSGTAPDIPAQPFSAKRFRF